MSTPAKELPLVIGAQELQNLQAHSYGTERLHRLNKRLHDSLKVVPKEMFANRTIPTLGAVLSQGHRLIPLIPHKFGFEWFLQNIAEMNRYDRKPWKIHQPEEITEGIWYWRLDNEHVMHRRHETAQWNVSIFSALLTEHQQTGSLKDDAVKYMEGYLMAVLESHNEPGRFTHRDEFLHDWKRHNYDFYTKKNARDVMNGLKARIDTFRSDFINLLPKIKDYQLEYGKFIDALIPGPPYNRDPNGFIRGKIDARLSGIPTPDHEYRMSILRILDSAYPEASGDALPQYIASEKVVTNWFALETFKKEKPKAILKMLNDRFSGN
jgi:hypothetical protein